MTRFSVVLLCFAVLSWCWGCRAREKPTSKSNTDESATVMEGKTTQGETAQKPAGEDTTKGEPVPAKSAGETETDSEKPEDTAPPGDEEKQSDPGAPDSGKASATEAAKDSGEKSTTPATGGVLLPILSSEVELTKDGKYVITVQTKTPSAGWKVALRPLPVDPEEPHERPYELVGFAPAQTAAQVVEDRKISREEDFPEQVKTVSIKGEDDIWAPEAVPPKPEPEEEKTEPKKAGEEDEKKAGGGGIRDKIREARKKAAQKAEEKGKE